MKNENSLSTITCIHGRHDKVRLFAITAPRPVYAAVSTIEDYALSIELGFKTIIIPNKLAWKWQTAVAFALTHNDSNKFILLGSDDLIKPSMVAVLTSLLDDYDFIGLKGCIFHGDGKTKAFHGYEGKRESEPIGAGRCITRSALNKINPIFSEARTGGLDGNFWDKAKNLKRLIIGIQNKTYSLVDLKDNFSRQKMDKFEDLPDIELPKWACEILCQ